MSSKGTIYKHLKKLLHKFNFDLTITKNEYKTKDCYEPIFPVANYAPWLTDNEFNNTYNKIKNHTLVDKYKCYGLWELVKQSKKLKGALIEVGAWKGGTAGIISKQARWQGISDPIYVCDTFEGVVKSSHHDLNYVDGVHDDTNEDIVKDLLTSLNVDNVHVLKGIYPEDTGKLVYHKQFRFAHVDVDTYLSAKDVVADLWPKMVVGGIVVFDCYGFQSADGITKYVNEQRNKPDRIVLYNLNGHGVMIKI